VLGLSLLVEKVAAEWGLWWLAGLGLEFELQDEEVGVQL